MLNLISVLIISMKLGVVQCSQRSGEEGVGVTVQVEMKNMGRDRGGGSVCCMQPFTHTGTGKEWNQ